MKFPTNLGRPESPYEWVFTPNGIDKMIHTNDGKTFWIEDNEPMPLFRRIAGLAKGTLKRAGSKIMRQVEAEHDIKTAQYKWFHVDDGTPVRSTQIIHNETP